MISILRHVFERYEVRFMGKKKKKKMDFKKTRYEVGNEKMIKFSPKHVRYTNI